MSATNIYPRLHFDRFLQLVPGFRQMLAELTVVANVFFSQVTPSPRLLLHYGICNNAIYEHTIKYFTDCIRKLVVLHELSQAQASHLSNSKLIGEEGLHEIAPNPDCRCGGVVKQVEVWEQIRNSPDFLVPNCSVEDNVKLDLRLPHKDSSVQMDSIKCQIGHSWMA